MNNKEFMAELARRNYVRADEAQKMMNSLISAMGEIFQEGDSVQLPTFGSFEVRKKLERVMTNPATGQRMLVPPKLTLTFKPASFLKDMVKKGGEDNC